MTISSEFDPLDPQSLPAAEDQPIAENGDDEFGGLEGMIFSPYLTADDLAGKTWDTTLAMPEVPAVAWEDAPATESEVPKASALGTQGDAAQAVEPIAAWIEPSEKTEDKPGPETLHDLAVPDWLNIERPKPIEDAIEEGAEGSFQPAAAIASSVQEPLFTPLSIEEISVPPNASAAPDLLMPSEAEAGTTHERQLRPSFAAQNVVVPELPAASVFAPPWEEGTESDASEPARPSIAEIPIAVTKGAPVAPLLLQEGLTEIVEATTAHQGAADVSGPPRAPLAPTQALLTRGDQIPKSTPDQPIDSAAGDIAEEIPLFHSFYKSAAPAPARIPNLAHSALLGVFAVLGGGGAMLIARLALNFHLFGINSAQEAATDVHYTIGSMVAFYAITFGAAALLFPIVWERGFFAGLQWNAPAAWRNFWPLLGAASVCFVLAMLDEILLPGPTNAPIDQLFDNSAAAWLLFAFGVTFAPFFEEIIFRGFLLPTLCTAVDWTVETAVGVPPRPLGHRGHPQWSMTSMIIASICTSIPFALMHADQTAWSLGPFLLLVTVSLVLCWTRLSTRSLAASVMVHALYNLLLFSLMFLGTGGFKHLDKM